MVTRNHAKSAEVTLVVAWVFKVWSVGYVEGVAMQFQNLAFHNLEVLLQAEVVNSIAWTENLVPSEGSHARIHAASRSIRRQDGGNSTGKGSGVKPMTAYALRIADRSDEVRTIATRISTACRSKIDRLAGLKKENVIELPSADHRVQGARSV